MWIYGPSREEKSKRLHSFNKYPARSLQSKMARGASDPSRLRNFQKTAQKPQNMNKADF